MNDTDKKAGRGMLAFVLAIFAIALVLALIATVAIHPGSPASPGIKTTASEQLSGTANKKP